MSFTSEIYTSMSALNATGTGLSTVGNNLANLNTNGFKAGRAQFEDVLSSVLGQAPPDGIGSGVTVEGVETQFTDGPVQTTNNPLDFAISGNGFFPVANVNHNNIIDYTRAGAFSMDKNNNIVDPNGNILQGYLAGASGNISTSLTSLNLSALMSSSVNGVTGTLTGLSLNNDGTIEGTYDNGTQQVVAQVVLADFNAPTELANAGNNLLAATGASGSATLLTPGQKGAGTVTGSALEQSNVNENAEFGSMIAMQEGFQINSQAMQAADTEYTNIVNMTI